MTLLELGLASVRVVVIMVSIPLVYAHYGLCRLAGIFGLPIDPGWRRLEPK